MPDDDTLNIAPTRISPELLYGLLIGIKDQLKGQDRILVDMDKKLDQSALDHLWIETEGKPLSGRVSKLERAGDISKGRMAGVALAASALTAVCAAFGKGFLLALARVMQ